MQEKESLIPFLFLSLFAHLLFLGGALWFSSRIETVDSPGDAPIMVELMGDFSKPAPLYENPPPVREVPVPDPVEPIASPPEKAPVEERVTLRDPDKKIPEEKKPPEEPKEKPPVIKRSATIERRNTPASTLNRTMVDTALAEIARNLETQPTRPSGGATAPSGVRGNLEAGRALELYRAQVAHKVQQNWTHVGGGNTGGSVTVAFRVTRIGRVQRLVVQQSSGDSHVDESARRAILKAEPFSPIPEAVSDAEVVVRLRFTDKGVDL